MQDRRVLSTKEVWGYTFMAASAFVSLISASLLFMFISGKVPQTVQNIITKQHVWSPQAEICYKGYSYVIFSNGAGSVSQPVYDGNEHLVVCK